MTNYERIKKEKFFYKMGVICGNTLYFTYKFDDFEEMVEKANAINNRYKSDMQNCRFVIQAFRDNSYDFEKSCFAQIEVNVRIIDLRIESIAGEILQNSEESL